MVRKHGNTHSHDWKKTERRIPGAVLKFHGCVGCKTLEAYDMVVINRNEFRGSSELAGIR